MNKSELVDAIVDEIDMRKPQSKSVLHNVGLPRLLLVILPFLFTLGNVNPLLAAEPVINTSRIINLIANRFVEVGVSVARSQARIKYDSITYNDTLGTLTLNGLLVRPLPNMQMDRCAVKVGSVNVASLSSAKYGQHNLEISLDNFELSPLCLPFTARGIMAMAGLDTIHIPGASIKLVTDFPSGAMEVLVSGELESAFVFSAYAELPYFSILENDPLFLASLRKLEFTVSNLGAWENLSDQLPAKLTQNNFAGDYVSSYLRETVFAASQGPNTEQFLVDVRDAWEAFLLEPELITLRSNILSESGVDLDTSTLSSPESLLSAIKPSLVVGSLEKVPPIGKPLLQAIRVGNYDVLSEVELLDVGKRFVHGDDLPKNEKVGTQILEELVGKGNADATEELAALYFEKRNYDKAYSLAIRAGAQGNYKASNLMNLLETYISLEQVLEIQALNESDNFSFSGTTPPKDYYKTAVAYLNGNSVPRSYRTAYFWAILSKANGDIRGKTIIQKVKEIRHSLNDNDRSNWDRSLEEVEAEALSVWFDTLG